MTTATKPGCAGIPVTETIYAAELSISGGILSVFLQPRPGIPHAENAAEAVAYLRDGQPCSISSSASVLSEVRYLLRLAGLTTREMGNGRRDFA